MKLHLITVGQPKLAYAKAGWDEYWGRLRHYHSLRVTHVPDKYAYDPHYLLQAAANAYKVSLVIAGPQLTSPQLADFLDKKALEGREVCFLVGGPKGLPASVISNCDKQWGLSQLTFPHDLAMVVLLEALYRASTINASLPYHK